MKIISNTYTNEWMQHDDDYTTAILATRYSYTHHSPGIQQGNYLHNFFYTRTYMVWLNINTNAYGHDFLEISASMNNSMHDKSASYITISAK